VFCFLAAWQIAVSLFGVPRILLPSVLEIAKAYAEYAGLLGNGLVVTGFEVLVSFTMSVVVGILLGVITVKSRLFSRAVLPLLVAGQSVPILAAAPLFVVWFGFDLTPKVLVALLITFFPILMGTVLGLRSSDPDILALARSMGFGAVGRFTKIELPGALPYLFASLKVAATLVVVGVIVGEFVGSSAGLGYIVLRAAGTINTPLLFAALGLMVLIGLLMSGAVSVAERLATPWRFER
jgi:NitT/TauT family transport system permease protein